LADAGHDVTAIARDYPAALTDEAVLAIADQERRILITNDRDFGELIFRQRRPHAGIMYFRLPLASSVNEKLAWLQLILTEQQAALGKFLVVTPGGLRVS
jgi:predicted nuclease of predicted toxin-antitoxin system